MSSDWIIALVKYLIIGNDMYIMYAMYTPYVMHAWSIKYV